MRLLVYMKDGRTCYRIVGRGKLGSLIGRDGTDDNGSLFVEKGIWNPETGDYVWRGARLRHIASNSISHIEEDQYPAKVAA